MTPASRWIYATTFLLAAAGFLLELWPLCVTGVLLAALSGRWLFAVLVALLIDVAWGAPTGALGFILFPLTALALIAALARMFGSRYFLDKNLPEKL